MKNQIFIVLGMCLMALMPKTIVANAENSVTSTDVVDIQGDYVSFDDIVRALKGEMTEVEEGRFYQVEDKVFSLNYGKGYSSVDEQPEPYLLEVSKTDEAVKDIICSSPILFNEELFVPIAYVERLLGLSYNDGVFDKGGEPLFKGEDFVVVTPPTEEELPEVTEPESNESVTEKPTVKPEVEVGGNEPIQTPESNQPSKEEILTVKQVLVNKGSIKLEVGQTDKVNAVVDPFNVADASISWSSSNSNVVTVDGKGNVYAVAEGQATLTVTSNMNPSAKAVVTVTVTPPPVVNATSVSVNQKWIDLEVGGSVKVSAWVAPENTTNKGITWSSENSSIASVDGQGNIVAKGAGYTRIVATAVSNGGAKAYIEVNVKEKVVAAPTPEPTPQPTPNPNPTPQAPVSTVRGDSVISQLLNEGFRSGNGGAYWHPVEGNIATEWQDVSAEAFNGGVSLHVLVAGYYGDESYSKAQQVFSKILPSSASTVVSYIRSGKAGTFTFDGRKVVIEYGYKASVTIH